MKILFIILFLPICAAGQIPRDANTIIVKDVGFSQVCNALLDSGYAIQKKDNDLFTVRTERRDYPKYWSAQYIVDIRVKDSVAYISATIFSSVFNDKASHHTNAKGKTYPKSLIGYPFLLVSKWAECFGKELSYEKL